MCVHVWVTVSEFGHINDFAAVNNLDSVVPFGVVGEGALLQLVNPILNQLEPLALKFARSHS